jgi:hypothetical protein
MFNIIDAASGWTEGLMIGPPIDFGEEAFSRRMPANMLGTDVAVQSPEDTILSKLSRGKDSGWEMQYRDAVGVAVQQWDHLDQEYLRRWAMELGVSDVLEKLLADAAGLA